MPVQSEVPAGHVQPAPVVSEQASPLEVTGDEHAPSVPWHWFGPRHRQGGACDAVAAPKRDRRARIILEGEERA